MEHLHKYMHMHMYMYMYMYNLNLKPYIQCIHTESSPPLLYILNHLEECESPVYQVEMPCMGDSAQLLEHLP